MNSLLQFAAVPTSILLGQAEPVPEVSVGGVLSGLIILMMLGLSALMGITWVRRFREGEDLLPAAFRKPLRVPLPLLIVGLGWTGWMAWFVLTAKPSIPVPKGADPNGENVADAAADESSPDAEDSAADPLKPLIDPEELQERPHVDPDDTERHALVLILNNLTMNVAVLCAFGVIIWIAQLDRSRKPLQYDDVSYISRGDAPTSPEESVSELSDEELDVDSEPDLQDEDSYNPFLAPSQPPATTKRRREIPDQGEVWDFRTELRFAGEIFLVAYLPTALARILILLMQPDAPSHPFLEMMNNGVQWLTVVAIAAMAVVVAPVVEELTYRATILGGFMQRGFTWTGLVVSSVLFSFAHGFPDSIALLPLAFFIGYLYTRRRSYRTVVLVHLLFNGFNMLIASLAML